MQAIVTKYLTCTNTLPSRIKASCERGSIIVSTERLEVGGDMEKQHIAVADMLVQKFVKEDAARYGAERNPWNKPRVCGWIQNGLCAHVFIP